MRLRPSHSTDEAARLRELSDELTKTSADAAIDRLVLIDFFIAYLMTSSTLSDKGVGHRFNDVRYGPDL